MEDLNNILNSGDVVGIYQEKVKCFVSNYLIKSDLLLNLKRIMRRS